MFLLLELPCQLGQLLSLLLLDLIVLAQLVLAIIDLTSYEAAVVLRARDEEHGPFHLHILLAEHIHGLRDVALDFGLLLGQACILVLHAFEFGLEHLLVSHLLLNLVLVIRAQKANAFLQVAPSHVDLVDLCPECVVQRV